MKLFMRLLLVALLSWTATAFAEFVVIVHPSNQDNLNLEMVQRIYLGKTKGFPTAGKAVPLDLLPADAARAGFLANVVKKTQPQYTAYWAKLMFTGKGIPPKQIESEKELVMLVSKNPNLIGYVDASAVTDDVRVVARF